MKRYLFLLCGLLVYSMNCSAVCESSESVWSDLCKDLKKECPADSFFAVIPEGDVWSRENVRFRTACISCDSEEEIGIWYSCGDSTETIQRKCPDRYIQQFGCAENSVLFCRDGEGRKMLPHSFLFTFFFPFIGRNTFIRNRYEHWEITSDRICYEPGVMY